MNHEIHEPHEKYTKPFVYFVWFVVEDNGRVEREKKKME